MYPLATVKGETTEIIFKKPHEVIVRYWEERFQQIDQYLRQQLANMDAQAPAPLQGLEDHLFVDAAYARIVRANLEEVRAALQALQLRLEKIRFSYNDC